MTGWQSNFHYFGVVKIMSGSVYCVVKSRYSESSDIGYPDGLVRFLLHVFIECDEFSLYSMIDE